MLGLGAGARVEIGLLLRPDLASVRLAGQESRKMTCSRVSRQLARIDVERRAMMPAVDRRREHRRDPVPARPGAPEDAQILDEGAGGGGAGQRHEREDNARPRPRASPASLTRRFAAMIRPMTRLLARFARFVGARRARFRRGPRIMRSRISTA